MDSSRGTTRHQVHEALSLGDEARRIDDGIVAPEDGCGSDTGVLVKSA
jgi:hypothetical protein